MRKSKLGLNLVWAGTLLYATASGPLAASAAPLELKQVAAGAKWLGHVDFDAVRESIVVQKAMAKHMEKHKNAEVHFKMIQALVGMDPRTDLHGATFYGTQIGKHTGVMILHAKLDQKKLSAWAEKIPGRQAAEHGEHKISSWTKKHGEHSHTLASCWYGDDRLVIASSVDELRTALDVLDGKSAGVGDDSSLAGPVAPGATVLGRVSGVAEAELKCKNPVAKQTKSFRFVVGESNGKSYFRARAEMTNTEVVGQMKEIVEGGQSLARLCSGDNELKLRMVNGLNVDPDGATLTLAWSGSAEDVWQQLEVASRKWEAHMAKMREHGGRHGWHGHRHEGKPDEKKDAPKKKAPASEDAI